MNSLSRISTMVSSLKLLTTVALAVSSAVAQKDGVYEGEIVGSPNGNNEQLDSKHVKPAQKLRIVSIRAAKRVDAVILEVTLPDGQERQYYHGGTGGELKSLTLADDEHVNSIEYHTGERYWTTRIFYIKFSTNKGNFLEGGTKTDDVVTDTAKDGYQLGDFLSSTGDEVDLLAAVWTSILPITDLAPKNGIWLGPPVGVIDGGYNSDIEEVKPAQKVRIVSIRAAERVDAVMLNVTLPNAQEIQFYHGGEGGELKSLALADDEHVTKIEYHMGLDHSKTRIFYIKLSTNKGNFLEGGSTTDYKKKGEEIDEAPDRYQLAGFQSFTLDELTMLSAIWTSIDPIPAVPATSGGN
ncbi:hypothetical protein PsorP6_010940 [Peronosclerospora sorghi]|uniref:Uncharacterized protein n=1 Tax=Peronosclerospora sorghi TaxID=230839 RepID=A0ACC0VWI6_9STRA|nr:hypothetical protein PsorP6_010940 [Peronosclerospora sorghi]